MPQHTMVPPLLQIYLSYIDCTQGRVDMEVSMW